MASALIGGVIEAKLSRPEAIRVSDCASAAVEAAHQQHGVRVCKDNADLVNESETILLCVKPADALGALSALGQELAGKRVISIVAGLSLERLETAVGGPARLIRVMPNTPALIHRGAAAYARGTYATDADADAAKAIFSAVGLAVEVKEELLDAVTGLSGSGPAYGYLLIEALSDAGVRAGLPREMALRLAAQTLRGAAEMVLQTGEHPAVLKDHVTSPGGTTIAGIEALEAGGVRAALMAAVAAATTRSRELGAGQ